MHQLVQCWQGQGLRAVVYLDHALCAMKGRGAAAKASKLVQCTIEQAGFAVLPSKSIWEPTHCLVWLGFVIDKALGQIEVPES